MIATFRKHISTEVVDGVEVVKNYIKTDDKFPENVHDALNEVFEDYDNAQYNGVFSDEDGNYHIVIDSMLEYVESDREELKADGEDNNLDNHDLLIKYFKDWKVWVVNV